MTGEPRCLGRVVPPIPPKVTSDIYTEKGWAPLWWCSPAQARCGGVQQGSLLTDLASCGGVPQGSDPSGSGISTRKYRGDLPGIPVVAASGCQHWGRSAVSSVWWAHLLYLFFTNANYTVDKCHDHFMMQTENSYFRYTNNISKSTQTFARKHCSPPLVYPQFQKKIVAFQNRFKIVVSGSIDHWSHY